MCSLKQHISVSQVFPRSAVQPVKPANWYHRIGRQVMVSEKTKVRSTVVSAQDDEEPVKEKNDTNPINGEMYTVGLFGYWQTEPWDGGEVDEEVRTTVIIELRRGCTGSHTAQRVRQRLPLSAGNVPKRRYPSHC